MFEATNSTGHRERYCWLDFLRGVAALSILVWHYQHFYYVEAGITLRLNRSDQPFFDILSVFYLYGLFAVQFFWGLSGFVLAHTYFKASKAAGPKSFLISRFARLYPLHFITLLCIAALQVLSFYKFGHYQIYTVNDLYHFILNLFFISFWGLQSDFSFNAPIWSVSAEIFV